MNAAVITHSRALTIGLISAIFAGWTVTLFGMDTLHVSLGKQGNPLAGYLISWIVMLTAMMLPAEMRFVAAFHQFSAASARQRNTALTACCFVGGYFLIWSLFGVAAYLADEKIAKPASTLILPYVQKSTLAGLAIIAAGFYQLSPLKEACLNHCVSPLSFFYRKWQPGVLAAVRLGIEHGAICVGCCWGLMLVMLVMGCMDLFWMSAVGLVMFAEKIFSSMRWFSKPVAIALVLLGLWLAFAPQNGGFHSPSQHLHVQNHAAHV